MHPKAKKMDLDTLDELISKCEDAMVSPFKKKPAVAVEIEGSPAEEAKESPEEEKAEDKNGLGESDLDDLLEMYQSLKGKKG
ncbi:hypothetical protein ACSSNN_23970 [Escherichia coli]|uniref:hypothetical protein n=1 Tax=Escherichia coli TaxID=562 RepID=UPI003F43FFD6